MPTIIQFTQNQVNAIYKNSVAIGTAVQKNQKIINPLMSYATLQHISSAKINHNLSNLPKIELLVLQKSSTKDILWQIANHLNLTKKPQDLCDANDLQEKITANIIRLAEMKSHPAFCHLKGIKVNFKDCQNFIVVFKTEYLHSPIGLNLPPSIVAQTLDNLNLLFSQLKKNQALDSLITNGFFQIGNKGLSEFLTHLSGFYLSDEIQFHGSDIKELLEQSRGKWLLKHIPESMN